MIECAIKELVKYYGANKIFENISFDIRSSERVGLIGRNGIGKTTIIKILMGKEDYQGGNISIRKGAVLGYLEQIPDYSEEFTVIDILYLAFEEVFNLKNKMNSMENEFPLLIDEELRKSMKKYGDLQIEFQRLGGYEIDEKISKITTGLKITNKMRNMKFTNLSGGEKSRVVLAKILLDNPDILLLDEPSNHLDLKSVEWLENYLKRYNGAVLIISHDRFFLDKVANKIVEIDSDGAQTYNGNYSYYVIEKERRFLIAINEYKAQQRKIKKMEEQIERYRIWGKMRDSEKMFKRAKELEKRLSKIEKLDKPNIESSKIRLSYVSPNRTGKEVLKLEKISKSFSEKTLFSDVDLCIYYQDGLGLLGDNGSGKSTLLKIIIKEIQHDSGNVILGSRLKIGYLPQEIYFNDEEMNVLETFARNYGITFDNARRELAKMLFINEDVFKKIKSLSGGEKSRLKLAMLMYEEVNFLILDEPTNHLDIDSREILEESLVKFTGTILFVSHDRYFINKIATRIAEIDNNNIKMYNSNYENYLIEKQKTIEISKIKENKKLKKNCNNKNKDIFNKQKEKEIVKIKKSVKTIESSIAEMEKEIEYINSQMELFNNDIKKLNELYELKTSLNKELSESYDKWENANQKLEDICK